MSQEDIVLIIKGGRNFVGIPITVNNPTSNAQEVTGARNLHEVILLIGQEMQTIPIKLGDAFDLTEDCLIIMLSPDAPFYKTYKQVTSVIHTPGGPTLVGHN
jgi:hypothetical protein